MSFTGSIFPGGNVNPPLDGVTPVFEMVGADPSIAPGLDRPPGSIARFGATYYRKFDVAATDWEPTPWTGGGGGGGTEANWTLGTTRWFAIDEDNGNDANTGWGATPAAAVANAVATPGRLMVVIPAVGNGRRLGLLVVPRALGADYSAPLFLRGKVGYEAWFSRATHDGADTALERIICGAVNSPNGAGGTGGPGAGGVYSVGAGVHAIEWTIAAGSLPAANSLEGHRIRWAPNTTTVALRNTCSRIYSHTAGAGATIVANQWTGAGPTPAAGDTFFIERPGAVFPGVAVDYVTNLSGTTTSSIGWVWSGISCSSTDHVGFSLIGGYGNMSFVHCGSTYFRDMAGLALDDYYYNFDEALTITGVGMLCTGDYQFYNTKTLVVHSVTFSGTGVIHGFENIDRAQLCGKSSSLARPPVLNGVGFGHNRYPDSAMGIFGDAGGGGPRFPTKITGGHATDIFSNGSNLQFTGLILSGLGGNPLRIAGDGGSMVFSLISSGAGNTDVAIDFTRCRQCRITLDGSATGTVGDLRIPGNALPRWLDFTKTNIVDNAGNNFMGIAGGNVVPQCVLAENDSGVTVAPGMAAYFKTSAAGLLGLSDSNAAASTRLDGVIVSSADDGAPVYLATHGRPFVLNTGETVAHGALAYVTSAAGILGASEPAVGEWKLRAGYWADGSDGTSGHVVLRPELLAVPADGLL